MNLATHLVHDAHLGVIDCAVIITNDSDLAEPMRIVQKELGITVGLISPTLRPGRHPSRQLVKHADFVKQVRKGVLGASQFASPIVDEKGPIHKPATW